MSEGTTGVWGGNHLACGVYAVIVIMRSSMPVCYSQTGIFDILHDSCYIMYNTGNILLLCLNKLDFIWKNRGDIHVHT